MSDDKPPLKGVAVSKVVGYAILKAYNKPPEEHPIYPLIGRVSAEWALMEHRLDEIIWSMAGATAPRTACLTGQMMGHAPRFNTIIALLNYQRMDQGLIDEVEALRGAVSGMAEDRNRIVHDAWFVEAGLPLDETSPHQYRAMPKRDLNFGIHQKPIDEIKAFIAKIGSKIESINRLAEKIAAARIP